MLSAVGCDFGGRPPKHDPPTWTVTDDWPETVPGASATNDCRPKFQRMIDASTSKPAPFDVLIVHAFSRFFRDHFELEFYVPSGRRWSASRSLSLAHACCGSRLFAGVADAHGVVDLPHHRPGLLEGDGG
ncbi:recombinase family protein [Xanthobacter autotrophicus]|uniref:recombinase family protein n=1 Tax=Xanthobacter autotrophicus TaxID=280 RepID=UPI003729121F